LRGQRKEAAGIDTPKLQQCCQLEVGVRMPPTESPANLSRQIQTAVQSIAGTTELALRWELTPAQREQLDSIKRLAEGVLQLLNASAAGCDTAASPDAAPAAVEAAVVDWSAALKRAHHNEALLREMSRLFVAECPRLLEQIETALAAEDRAQVRRAAGKLKGSAGIFAARDAAEAAAQLDQMADERPVSEMTAVFQTLRERAAKVCHELQRFLETGARASSHEPP
jgi:HPt (histidine-containing phosphotransfer) domain-containing protein